MVVFEIEGVPMLVIPEPSRLGREQCENSRGVLVDGLDALVREKVNKALDEETI